MIMNFSVKGGMGEELDWSAKHSLWIRPRLYISADPLTIFFKVLYYLSLSDTMMREKKQKKKKKKKKKKNRAGIEKGKTAKKHKNSTAPGSVRRSPIQILTELA